MKKKIFLLITILSVSLFAEKAMIYHSNLSVENKLSAQSRKLSTDSSEKVPWTSKPVLDNPMNFHFAIVSDRTGGHRDSIFSNAMYKVNLLQPDFIICVGDLIEGATTDVAVLNKEFDEMDSILNIPDMKFYRVPGNHDIGNKTMLDVYKKRYGNPYYSFVYKNVLFLILSTEDPPLTKISEEQVAFVKNTLEKNKNVRWTFVFMHQPMYQEDYKKKCSNWPAIEKMLQSRDYTVFAGHYHGYSKITKFGKTYIRLATTGAASNMSGIKNGAFDEIMWVTITDNGPVFANILLDGLLNENLK